MKIVVITGSTRGIGYGLADAFLDRDCSVTISGRSEPRVQEAVSQLAQKFPIEQILGHACDVTEHSQVQSLWDITLKNYGRVDIWINNAGISGDKKKIWEISPKDAHDVLDTNIVGALYGTQVAVLGMLDQGFGAIYNMEGMGSDGRMHDGLSIYGTSKYALKYLTDTLVLETKEMPIIIGALRPGMVITNLVLDRYLGNPKELEKTKRIFNIIADTVENVTPWLADQILANEKTGVRIKYASALKLLGRFLSAPFSKRDLFANLDLE